MLKYFAIFLFYTVSINAQTLDSLIISEFKAVKEFALITGFASLKEKSNIKNKSIELEVSPKIKSKFDSININITNVGKMTSFQNGQINFNTIEFSKHYDYYFEDELMLKLLIQFYVAHELAHQVQFIKYKKNNIKNYKVLEAQADMFSGLVISFNNFLYNIKRGNENEQDINDCNSKIRFLSEIVFDLGTEENTYGTHPSKIDRVWAIKEGLKIGNILAGAAWLDKNGVPSADNYRKKNLKNINFTIGENFFDWSYRTAKRIVNYNPSTAKYLLYLEDLTNNFISKDSKYFHYDISYKNISDKEIQVSMEIFTKYFKTKESKSPKYFVKPFSNIYSYNLKPGEIKRITGQILRFSKDEELVSNTYCPYSELSATLSFPKPLNDSSFFSISFMEETQKQENIEEYLLLYESENNKEEEIFETQIPEILRKFEFSNYYSIATGIGQYNLNNNLTFHSTKFNFGQNSRSLILSFRPDEYTIETVENYFDIKLEKNKIFNTYFFINNSFENKIEALKSFDKCVNILKKCLKKKQPYADYIQRPEVENELKHFSILYKIKENIIVCSISIVKDSVANLPPKWSVEISFSKLIKTG